jgi:hypothetical protein
MESSSCWSLTSPTDEIPRRSFPPRAKPQAPADPKCAIFSPLSTAGTIFVLLSSDAAIRERAGSGIAFAPALLSFYVGSAPCNAGPFRTADGVFLLHNRYFSRAAATALVALLLNAGVVSAAPTAGDQPDRAESAKDRSKLSPRERRRIRKSLARQLQGKPSVVLDRRFLRRAALVEFRLPMSARLLAADGQGGWQPSDDELEITWDDSAFAWPLAPTGVLAPAQTLSLSGRFTMESVFNGGDASGYGELGATETVFGTGIAFGSDPFTISEFAAACPDGPQLQTDPNPAIQITSAGGRYGVMNLFSHEIRGTLALRMTFVSNIAAGCGVAPEPTDAVDNSSAPPIPVRFNGRFTISPALTSDGKMRFGKIAIDDAVTPQLSTFGFVRSCTQAISVGPCDAKQFPARFKFKRLTADVLLGDVLP